MNARQKAKYYKKRYQDLKGEPFRVPIIICDHRETKHYECHCAIAEEISEEYRLEYAARKICDHLKSIVKEKAYCEYDREFRIYHYRFHFFV